MTPIGDNSDLPCTVHQSAAFARWFSQLRDVRARAAIARRITRLRLGNFGDARSLGGGLYELRVNMGPGYRIYLIFASGSRVILLLGGSKRSQSRDIARARRLAGEL